MSDVRVFDDRAALARAAAEFFAESASAAIDSRGAFSVALAGGSTPKDTYRTLASPDTADKLEWPKVHVFWGDERCVDPEDPGSNYRMAYESLLSRVPVPQENVHRMETDLPPERAAELYAAVLRKSFALAAGEIPRFDLILLGMGSDGHTASLFPGDDISLSTDRLVVASSGERHGYHRLSLTMPVINNSACVAFLVTGEEKAKALKEVLAGRATARRDASRTRPTPEELGGAHARAGGSRAGRMHYASTDALSAPARLVAPRDGGLVWFVDGAAAAGFNRLSQSAP